MRLLSILKLDKLCNEKLLKPLEDSQEIIFCILLFWTEYIDSENMEDIFHNLYYYMMFKMDSELSFSMCSGLNITKYCRK